MIKLIHGDKPVLNIESLDIKVMEPRLSKPKWTWQVFYGNEQMIKGRAANEPEAYGLSEAARHLIINRSIIKRVTETEWLVEWH